MLLGAEDVLLALSALLHIGMRASDWLPACGAPKRRQRELPQVLLGKIDACLCRLLLSLRM